MASEPSSASARPSSAKVKTLENKQAYVRAMNADGLTIIEGTATWCAQCKAIAPEVDKLAEEFSQRGVTFYQFDVEEHEDIAHELGVSVMPTFTIFKDGDIMEGVSGARAKALREAIEKNL